MIEYLSDYYLLREVKGTSVVTGETAAIALKGGMLVAGRGAVFGDLGADKRGLVNVLF